MSYKAVVKRVNIGDLKAKLSAPLKLVQDGQEVLVCDERRTRCNCRPSWGGVGTIRGAASLLSAENKLRDAALWSGFDALQI